MNLRWWRTPSFVLLLIAGSYLGYVWAAPGDYSGHESSYPFKPFGAAAEPPVSRVVTGFFNGDTLRDAAVLRNDRVELYFDPTLYDAGMHYPALSANDLATLSGTGAGGVDELLTVGPEGLRAWTRHSDTDSFSVRTFDDDVWAGATLVRVADLDGDGNEEVIGVKAGLLEVLIVWEPTSPTPIFTGFSSPYRLSDVVPLDLDGNGVLELGLLAGWGIGISTITGTFTRAYPAPRSGGSISIIRQDELPDRLGWVTFNPGTGVDELYVVDTDGLSDPVGLGAIGVVSVSPADLDGDGDDDLLLTMNTSYDIRLQKNLRDPGSPLAASFVEGPAGYLLLDTNRMAVDASGNQGMATAADLDNDGDLDVLYPIRDRDSFFLYHNLLVAHDDWAPRLEFAFFTADPGDTFGDFRLDIEDGVNIPAEATHVEVVFWQKPDLSTPTTPESLYPALYLPIGGGEEVHTRPASLPPGPPYVGPPGFMMSLTSYIDGGPFEDDPTYMFVVELPVSDPADPTLHYWTHRYVQFAGDPEPGHIVHSWPPRIFAFTPELDGDGSPAHPGLEFLDEFAGSGSPFLISAVPPPPPPGSWVEAETEAVGSIVPIKPSLDYPEDEEPDVNPDGG